VTNCLVHDSVPDLELAGPQAGACRASVTHLPRRSAAPLTARSRPRSSSFAFGSLHHERVRRCRQADAKPPTVVVPRFGGARKGLGRRCSGRRMAHGPRGGSSLLRGPKGIARRHRVRRARGPTWRRQRVSDERDFPLRSVRSDLSSTQRSARSHLSASPSKSNRVRKDQLGPLGQRRCARRNELLPARRRAMSIMGLARAFVRPTSHSPTMCPRRSRKVREIPRASSRGRLAGLRAVRPSISKVYQPGDAGPAKRDRHTPARSCHRRNAPPEVYGRTLRVSVFAAELPVVHSVREGQDMGVFITFSTHPAWRDGPRRSSPRLRMSRL
jgi:hypothetical protein